MPPHFLGAIFTQPIDIPHSIVALLIGVAGGCFLAEVRLPTLRRAFARKPKPPTVQGSDHDGPWG
ncbi:MAG TPA: hypothetical protein VG227_04720 [Caulobacteraceae bacterium]|jgi:hypothetical protein|nr:hypothetical protein [Caulobacteraceae bacterium]